jgi:hypothetical protein
LSLNNLISTGSQNSWKCNIWRLCTDDSQLQHAAEPLWSLSCMVPRASHVLICLHHCHQTGGSEAWHKHRLHQPGPGQGLAVSPVLNTGVQSPGFALQESVPPMAVLLPAFCLEKKYKFKDNKKSSYQWMSLEK